MNNINILGTITKDIELKYTQNGTAIASFSIAYNEKRKQQDGSYADHPHFFDVTAIGKRCETINQYFRKGSRILINGSLDYQSWNTQEGQKRSKVGIKLNDFDFIDKKDNQSNNAQTNNYQQQGNTRPQSNNAQTNYQQPQPYQAPQPQYENAQGEQVTPQQYQANQRAQVPPSIDVDDETLPF